MSWFQKLSDPDGKKMNALIHWLEERFDFSQAKSFAEQKRVPSFKGSFWYYFGGVSLFLFIVQVATGILLLMYYRPSAEEAYESVQFLMAEVQFGWLVRSLPPWAANLIIFPLLV